MTTPVERGAEAICASRPHAGGGSEIVYEDAEDYARAVFKSIDRDELATAIDRAEKATKTGSKPQRQRLIADAIIAWLLSEGGES